MISVRSNRGRHRRGSCPWRRCEDNREQRERERKRESRWGRKGAGHGGELISSEVIAGVARTVGAQGHGRSCSWRQGSLEPRTRAPGSRDQRCWIDGLIGWFGGNRGGTGEALDRARWRARGSGGCRWRAMVGEGWIPMGILWSGGAAGRMGQVPRF